MEGIREEFLKKMISHINRKDWWHCPPSDPGAYQKRGKFFASSFREAEFWGRPLDEPQRVSVSNPLIGDEERILPELFGHSTREPKSGSVDVLDWRWELDERMRKAALAAGYDAIVLVTPREFVAFRKKGRFPRSVELNILRP